MKILLILGALVVLSVEARRVRVRPAAQEADTAEQQQVEYYAEQEEDDGTILISRQDAYGRPNGQQRYHPKPKPAAPKVPPVQTIRNYNKLNDDGSFTFGYEAADGSFKEETRGTDCVVRGKYGYIDPDGNKREFTYVSGNPCDPNAVQDEEEQPEAESGEENIPKGLPNIPKRPIKPIRPSLRQGNPTTLFQQDYNQQEEEEEENIPRARPVPTTPRPITLQPRPSPQPQQLHPQPSPTPRYPIPTFAQLEDDANQHQILRATARPQLLTPTPARPVSITPRPQSLAQANPPATTYRPQHSVTPTPKSRPTPRPQSINLDEELKNFQLEHNVVSTPAPRPAKPQTPGEPIYTSELIFDPNSGQYNTVVYQQLPQAGGDFNLRGRLQPYVAPQQPIYRPAPQPRPNSYPSQQALFQQQQAALVQQSQQLFQQQQRRQQEQAKRIPPALLQQEPQRFSPAPKPYQPFYYVSPDGERTALASGQIEAFLRGHSVAI